MNIAIYSRKSRLVEGSESIENQIEMCKEYISRNIKNVDQIFVYEDEGFSGKNIARPQFQNLLTDANNKIFNMLICYRLDRISRNIADFSSIITKLEELGISFISIREQFDTTSPMGRAMMYIASVFAQLERETIAERIHDNMIELSKDAHWLGGKIPLGYKHNKKLKQLDIDMEYSNIVLEIFNKYLEYDSISKVQTWLSQNDITTRNGKYFRANTISLILRNPVYCMADIEFYRYAKNNNMQIFNDMDEFKNNVVFGVYSYNKKGVEKYYRDMKEWIVGIGNHKAIIDSTIWVNVQKRLEINSVKAPRTGTSQEALLSGLLRCKNCGGAFRTVSNYDNKKRLKRHYYRCLTKVNTHGKACNIKNINGLEADKYIIDYIKNLSLNKKLLTKIINEYLSKSSLSNDEITLNKLEIEIKNNEKAIEKYTQNLIFLEDSAAAKYIAKEIEKLDNEIHNKNKRINELKRKIYNNSIRAINIDLFVANVEYAKENIDKDDIETQKSIVRKLIKKVTWDGENFYVTPRLE